VNNTETNVLLGTSYMRLVMENLDNHPVLASAAYNAGPGRAKKWRADRPIGRRDLCRDDSVSLKLVITSKK
jgi:soluble lytic murein transglycosylase